MSRLRILALLATLAALVTVLAACGSSSSENSERDPKDVLKEATFEGIESANLDMSLGIEVSGDEGGHVDVKLSGPFQSKGSGQPPELDMTAEASGSVNGEDVNFEGGLVLVPQRAFVSYEGTDYEVDPTTFGIVQSALEKAEHKNGGEGAGATACQKEAADAVKLEDFVENLKNEGSADVGGAETTKVSGNLDVAGAIEAITKLSELPACASQMEAAGPLPLGELGKAKGEVEKALKSAHADVYVGEDGIVRRVTAELEIEPPEGSETVKIDLDIALEGVNEEQEITVPSSAKPLNALFEKLGVNPLELLQGAENGEIGSLLEQFGGASGLGGAIPGAGAGGGGGAQQEYLECIQGASTPAELQACAKKIQ